MIQEIENILEKSGYCLEIKEVLFHKQTKTIELNLNSTDYIPKKKIDELAKNLESCLPKGVKVAPNIFLICDNDKLCSDFNNTVLKLKKALVSDYPECYPAIEASKWTLSDSKESIAIQVPDKYLFIMKKPVKTLRESYKVSKSILLESSDTDSDNETQNTDNTYIETDELLKAAVESIAIEKEKEKPKPESDPEVIVIYNKAIPQKAKLTSMESINNMCRENPEYYEDFKNRKTVVVKGELIDMTEDDAKHPPEDRIKRVIGTKTSAITFQKYFCRRTASDEEKKNACETVKSINSGFKSAKGNNLDLLVKGVVRVDKNTKEPYIDAADICAVPHEFRKDTSEKKRVELHLHTSMSEMDGITKQSDLLATASRWGHSAMAITDHGVVHAFPDAMRSAKKLGIKLLYGVEGYLQDDSELLSVSEAKEKKTVSVAVIGAMGYGEINLRELAAIRHDTGEIFHTYVNTGIPTLSSFEYKYDTENLSSAPSTEEALKELCQFIEGYTVVTYTPKQYESMCHKAVAYDLIKDVRYIDLNRIIHYIFTVPNPKINTEHIDNAFNMLSIGKCSFDLPLIYAKELAQKTQKLYADILDRFEKDNSTVPLMHGSTNNKTTKRGAYYHIILIAKTKEGLKNMYKMVSYSHSENFKYVPLMPRSLFSIRRTGIILGSACERGELFRAMLAGADDDKLKNIANWYDYLEIQPIGNNEFMIRNGTAKDKEQLRDFNRHILNIADSLNKRCVATGDVHFLEPEDSIFRSIIMHAQNFKDAEQQAPLYFKTTDEMLEEFSYLGTDRAMEVVVDNTNAIADMCDELEAYLNDQKTYAPVFDGANDELKNMSLNRAHQIYGDVLPEIVQKRLDFELNSIIGNNYSTLYLMAQRLVRKSNDDGYLVGSRGSVGSSLVAFLAGITEVNPLCAHYVCPDCHHSDFNHGNYWCGADMPDKCCPECGAKYVKYGFDIPFETFLGFKGDKTPDIDLNFSAEAQVNAHAYTKVMFGDDHSFRAGVINTLKDKTVFGYAKSFCDHIGMSPTHAELHRLVMGCTGVKRTTGQHPGGMVVVPPGYEAEDFMPLQYPANNPDGNGLITHFDFHAMDDKLVKLDILGHVDPTALRLMQEMTGLNPRDIPLDDKDTRALFSTSEPLKIDLSEINCDLGTIGIPEYGTTFVRGILKNTRPTTIEELVRLAGLSHGTNVWQGNAETLVMSGKAGLGDVIGTRDDIMLFLISKGSDPLLAFKTMESVRKGKGLTPEMEENMKKLSLPDWYIPSCKLIKYMFPRAHAAAYLTMAFRVAYYKMHYPQEFYAVYYTTRADDFDIISCSGGAEKVLKTKRQFEAAVKAAGRDTKTKSGESVAKLNNLSSILEVVYEMNLRGIEFLPIDINESDATKFKVKDGNLLPPFNAIGGVGAGNAEKIVEFRNKYGKQFTAVDEFQRVTGAGDSIMEKLEALGCFEGLMASAQTSLFDTLAF